MYTTDSTVRQGCLYIPTGQIYIEFKERLTEATIIADILKQHQLILLEERKEDHAYIVNFSKNSERAHPV